MTSWNAANDFVESRNGLSDATRQSVDPSASFDPARTGDPSPAHRSRRHRLRPCRPRRHRRTADAATRSASRRRRPGARPPSEPRFHTEISFKRHHAPASPRASSQADDGPATSRAGSSRSRLAAAATRGRGPRPSTSRVRGVASSPRTTSTSRRGRPTSRQRSSRCSTSPTAARREGAVLQARAELPRRKPEPEPHRSPRSRDRRARERRAGDRRAGRCDEPVERRSPSSSEPRRTSRSIDEPCRRAR